MKKIETYVTDCDYCGEVSLCFNDNGGGTCCTACAEKRKIKPAKVESK